MSKDVLLDTNEMIAQSWLQKRLNINDINLFYLYNFSKTKTITIMIKKHLLILFLTVIGFADLNAQVGFTANDIVVPYTGLFRPGVNPGYEPPYTDVSIADIAAGNPAIGEAGVGVKAFRTSLPDNITSYYGYPTWYPIYEHYQSLGLNDLTVILGDPRAEAIDYTEFCSTDVDFNGQPIPGSNLFTGLHLPIWDGGLNGTPYNDDNEMAEYTYNIASNFGDYITFYEIWNEPGLDYSGKGWRAPGDPFGNWWDQDPDPCDYKLKAPIEYFVRTLRVAYEVIKTVDPDAYVVLAGVGYESMLDAILRNTDNPVDGSPTAEYPLGGGAYFDVAGFHSYPHFDGSTAFREPPTYELVTERHSDAAANGLLKRQTARQAILENYGYDGITYPKKNWIVTELNLPSKQGFTHPDGWEYLGGELPQRNFIMKALVTAMEIDLAQVHVWKLGEREFDFDADDEFDNMGLYEKLEGQTVYNETPTTEGVAYHTTSDLIFGTRYDATRTAQMNLPAGVRGAALKDGNGNYTYALWAETTIDQSEFASATYSFPGSFGLDNLVEYKWDHSTTGATSNISPNNISLDATPIFVRGDDVVVPVLALNCPPNQTIQVPAGATFGTSNNITATASTTCTGGAVNVSASTNGVPLNGNSFPVGVTVINYTATDACGNAQSCTTTITVVTETQGGVLSLTGCSGNLNVNAGSNNTAVVSWNAPSATSTCAGGATLVQTNGLASGSAFPAGNTTVSYTATDACGNTETCSFTVTVNPFVGGQNTDIQLALSTDNTALAPWSYYTFTLTATNTSTVNATNLVIELINDNSQLVYDSQSVSSGTYNNWSGEWTVSIPAGGSETIDLRLFSLNAPGPYHVYAQVLSGDQTDSDSTPGNGACCTANEDDEAVATLGSGNQACAITTSLLEIGCNDNGTSTDPSDDEYTYAVLVNATGSNSGSFVYAANGVIPGTTYAYGSVVEVTQPANSNDLFTALDSGNEGCLSELEIASTGSCSNGGGDGIDLELDLTVDNTNLNPWSYYTFVLNVTNNSSVDATGVSIEFGNDFMQLVYDSQDVSTGNYNNWSTIWKLDIAAGATETVELKLFSLNAPGPYHVYAQVLEATQPDNDSTPGNGACCTANEDDEAVATLSSSQRPGIDTRDLEIENSNNPRAMKISNLFPVPTFDALNVVMESKGDREAILNIHDLTGKILMTVPTNLVAGTNVIELNVSDLQSGMYFIMIEGEALKTSQKRFVIQNQ